MCFAVGQLPLSYCFLLVMEEPAPGGLSLTIAIGYQPRPSGPTAGP